MLTSTAVETLRVSGPSVVEQLSAIIANKTSCARGRNQLFCYQVTGLEDRSEVCSPSSDSQKTRIEVVVQRRGD